VLAAVLSFLVPGLGQIYAGKQERGAAILVAGIVVGTLSLISQTLFLSFILSFMPASTARTLWWYRVPLSIYAVIFWIWQLVDAYNQAK
jgi:TM2 domain-containing membrane protein YozV